MGRRLTLKEVNDIFNEEQRSAQKTITRTLTKTLYGADGKPVNARKRKGASESIISSAIVAKLYKDGFIIKEGDGFRIDASSNLDDKYKDKQAIADIRWVLAKLVDGMVKTGVPIRVDDLEVNSENEYRDNGPEDENLGEVFRRIFGSVPSEDRDGGNGDS